MGSPAGYRASVSLLATGQIVSWAILYYAFTSFVLPMRGELGWSEPQTMGAFTLGLAMWGGCSVVAGGWIDRGRERAVMTGAAALAAIGLVLWSQARTLPVLYVAWALIGAAMAGSLYEAAFASVTRRYPLDYKRAVIALTLAGGFASTLAFPALAWLIPRFGWRGALLLLAVAMLLLVAPANALALRAQVPALAGASSHQGAAAVVLPGWSFERARRSSAFWLLAACFSAYAFVIAAFWAHAMPAFAAKGLSEAQAVGVLVWVGPAQVAGRALHLLGLARLPPRVVGLLVLCGLPLAMTLFALTTNASALLLFALLYGVSNGLVTIVRGTTVPDTFGAHAVGRIGGALAAISLAGRALAPLLTAWALLALGSYRALALALALLSMLAPLAYALVRPPPTDAC